jgi:hypothetical protein
MAVSKKLQNRQVQYAENPDFKQKALELRDEAVMKPIYLRQHDDDDDGYECVSYIIITYDI